jgi:hypothetical protein
LVQVIIDDKSTLYSLSHETIVFDQVQNAIFRYNNPTFSDKRCVPVASETSAVPHQLRHGYTVKTSVVVGALVLTLAFCAVLAFFFIYRHRCGHWRFRKVIKQDSWSRGSQDTSGDGATDLLADTSPMSCLLGQSYANDLQSPTVATNLTLALQNSELSLRWKLRQERLRILADILATNEELRQSRLQPLMRPMSPVRPSSARMSIVDKLKLSFLGGLLQSNMRSL